MGDPADRDPSFLPPCFSLGPRSPSKEKAARLNGLQASIIGPGSTFGLVVSRMIQADTPSIIGFLNFDHIREIKAIIRPMNNLGETIET